MSTLSPFQKHWQSSWSFRRPSCLKSLLYLKFITTFSHLLQFLSSCLTILVWYSCCIVACYRSVVRAYSPFLVSYTIRLYPVNLLQHWGLIARIYLAVIIVLLYLLGPRLKTALCYIADLPKNRLCLLCMYPFQCFFAISKLYITLHCTDFFRK